MRKLIINLFALSYTFKLFGWYFTGLKASRIIYPCMLLSGILSITNPNSPITFIAYGLTAISVFFGFVYFKIWPLTQTEIEEWIKQS